VGESPEVHERIHRISSGRRLCFALSTAAAVAAERPASPPPTSLSAGRSHVLPVLSPSKTAAVEHWGGQVTLTNTVERAPVAMAVDDTYVYWLEPPGAWAVNGRDQGRRQGQRHSP